MEERIFTIPLKKAFRVPRTKRAKKAIKVIREFLKRHMKVERLEDVVIGKSINEAVWKRGIQKPPRRIRVHAVVYEGKVYAELLGVDIILPSKKEEGKEEAKKEVKEEKKETEEKEGKRNYNNLRAERV